MDCRWIDGLVMDWRIGHGLTLDWRCIGTGLVSS